MKDTDAMNQPNAPGDPTLERYHRQMLLEGIQEQGQRLLRGSRVLVAGCGALGSFIVDQLARAGVGHIIIVDRDVVELTNLQRQTLFTEQDVNEVAAKAVAARNRVRQINSQVRSEACVDHLDAENVLEYARDVDVIMDGLDNFDTRYLLNDVSVKLGIPYVYGGAVGTTGMSFPILPATGRWSKELVTPCLRCLFPDPPSPGTMPTCDTAGVLAPAISMIAGHQVTQAIKLLTSNVHAVDRAMWSIDLWNNRFNRIDVTEARTPECPCCGHGILSWLDGSECDEATTLCGRNAVQIIPRRQGASDAPIDLTALVHRLSGHGRFTQDQHIVHGSLRERTPGGDPIELTVFPDGRAIIKGSTEPDFARGVYARYVGT